MPAANASVSTIPKLSPPSEGAASTWARCSSARLVWPAATTSTAALGLGQRGSSTAPGRDVLTAWLEAGAEATGAPAGALATTPSSEVAPDASSFYHGQYIPPGLQPGQAPEKCPT